MHTTSHKIFKALAVVFCWLPLLPAAEPIYRWEGADGSTHYSHSPPAADTGVDYEVLELAPPAAHPHAEGDYRSILDVADSLQAARLERERLRLERERTALEKEKLRQQARENADTPVHASPWVAFPHRFRPPHAGPGKHTHAHPRQPRIRQSDGTEREPRPTSRAIVGR